ncbi:MAG: glycosyltransferase family 1 protein [Patescibacteria group bacterium]
MKILIDARMYGLENAGIGRYAVNLITQITELDKSNDYVLLLKRKYFDELTFPANFKKVAADFRHYSFAEQLMLPKIINQEKPDLVHFLHFNVPVWFTGKFVVTIHDLLMHKQKGLEATTLNPALYYVKRLGYKSVFSNAVKKASKIIVPSKYVKEDIIKTYKVSPEKVVVTYEGVEQVKMTSANTEEILGKYNLTKDKYYLYVGSAYPHKNLKRTIEAAYLNRTPLAISCARNVFTEKLEKLVSMTGAKDYVKLLGFVPDEELSVLYKNSIGFVYPSLTEGFGLPGLEAMINGTILLASEIPVFKEVYKDNAVYFNPFDFSDIAKRMEIVKQMTADRRKELITKAQNFAKTYSWKKMAQETLDTYKSVI